MCVRATLIVALLFGAFPGISSQSISKDQTPRELQGPLCDYIASQITPGGNVKCQCFLSFIDLQIHYSCDVPTTCLITQPKPAICGTPTLSGKFGRGPSLVTTNCLNVTDVNPTAPSSLCVTGTHCSPNLGQVCSCSATLNGTDCNSCTVCSGGRRVSLDCTNVYSWANTTCVPVFL